MKPVLPLLLIFAAAAVLLSSCSQLQQQKPEEESQAIEFLPPLHLGAVHQVFPADKFALLRIIGPMPAEGTVLITHPADGTADRVGNLIVSSAQHARNNIIAADIRAGVVMKGDRVFQYRNIAAAPVEEEEEREATTLTGEELDLGYTPPDIEEKLTVPPTVQENATEPVTPVELTPQPVDLPEEEYTPEPPGVPSTQGLPKFDDIPDNINDWDSM